MDRHAETSDGYESEPSRSQQRRMAAQDDPAVRRPPGKKDPGLCKAAHWAKPHVPVFRLHDERKPCHWWINWFGEIAWDCNHMQACSGCGKILDHFVKGKRCPDWREATPEETARLERELEEKLLRIAAFRARRVKRPVITGPQGYRKPKAG